MSGTISTISIFNPCTIPTSRSVLTGGYTKTIYNLFLDRKYTDVINIVTEGKQKDTRPGLSLLSYSYYEEGSYANALECVTKLVVEYPDEVKYRLLHSKIMVKLGKYQQARQVLDDLDVKNLEEAVREEIADLRVAIAVEEGEPLIAIQLLEGMTLNHERKVHEGCLLLVTREYNQALVAFRKAMEIKEEEDNGKPYSNYIVHYYLALCHFYLHEYIDALEIINDLLQKLKDVSATYKETSNLQDSANETDIEAIIACLNLRSVIEFLSNDYESYHETLKELPFKDKEDFDTVTLHNHILFQLQMNPTSGEPVEELSTLLLLTEYPSSTLYNLVLAHFRVGEFEVEELLEGVKASDVAIEEEILRMIECLTVLNESPETCLSGLLELQHVVKDKVTKLVEIKNVCGEDMVNRSNIEYEEKNRIYKSIVFAIAQCYWRLAQFQEIEILFRDLSKVAELDIVCQIVYAHSVFYQGLKEMEGDIFLSAAELYEPIYSNFEENIQYLPKTLLGNLCVCYLMTNQNTKAEEIMSSSRERVLLWNKIKESDERYERDSRLKSIGEMLLKNFSYQYLIVGDLYCSIGNYQFGLLLVEKAFEFPEYAVREDQWKWAKSSVLNYLLVCADHSYSLDIAAFNLLHKFLGDVQNFCKDDPQNNGEDTQREENEELRKIADEAKEINSLLLQLYQRI